MHKDPVSLIPLRALADVFPFSAPNRPSPPCIPPAADPTLGLAALFLSPPSAPWSPVTARRHVRVHAHATIHACTVHRSRPLRRCLGVLAGTRSRSALLPSYDTTRSASAFPRKQAIFRRCSLVETRSCAHVCRTTIAETAKSISYISPFFCFPSFSSCFNEIRYTLPCSTLQN